MTEELDHHVNEYEQSLQMTCEESLSVAGEDALRIIRAGQQSLERQRLEMKRQCQEVEAREAAATEMHWLRLKDAVGLLIDKAILPFCNVNQFDPSTVRGGFMFNSRTFDVVISVPGCTEVAGLFRAERGPLVTDEVVWHKDRYDSRPDRLHWKISSFLILTSTVSDGPRFLVGKGSPLYHDDLAVALALAVDNYRVRNSLLAECLKKNKDREDIIARKKDAAVQKQCEDMKKVMRGEVWSRPGQPEAEQLVDLLTYLIFKLRNTTHVTIKEDGTCEPGSI